jgi:hypothetical protein
LEEAITYLENQRTWIGNYEQWRQQGYPVSSGLVEQAVAVMINRRMKRQGMRWKRGNATAIVALRVRHSMPSGRLLLLNVALLVSP